MFVVLQCFNNLPEEHTLGRSLKDRIAVTMQHAGVAITVTSVTDVLAFGVGAITVRARSLHFPVSPFRARLRCAKSPAPQDHSALMKFCGHFNWLKYLKDFDPPKGKALLKANIPRQPHHSTLSPVI